MAIPKCPSCGKPVAAKAVRCAWCGAQTGKPVEPESKAAEELEKEAREIEEWPGSDLPPAPLFPIGVWILVAVLAGTGAVVGPALLRLERGLGTGLFVVVLLALLGLIAGVLRGPLHYLSSRHLRSPADAVHYCFGTAAGGDFGRARRAVADHPLSLHRHEDLPKRWKMANPGDAFTEAFVGGVEVGTPEAVAPGAALVPVRVVLSRTKGLTVPFVGSYHVTRNQPKDLVKLVIEKDGRWFLVNALLADRLDRSLAEHLARRGRA
jgi:hypothetical protein